MTAQMHSDAEKNWSQWIVVDTASDCKQGNQRLVTLLQKLCSSDNRC